MMKRMLLGLGTCSPWMTDTPLVPPSPSRGSNHQAGTSRRAKFPENREFNREFSEKRAPGDDLGFGFLGNSGLGTPNSRTTEQGILRARTGNFSRPSREFAFQHGSVARSAVVSREPQCLRQYTASKLRRTGSPRSYGRSPAFAGDDNARIGWRLTDDAQPPGPTASSRSGS